MSFGHYISAKPVGGYEMKRNPATDHMQVDSLLQELYLLRE